MRKERYLITGANGEIGHGLISFLAMNTRADILALDLMPLDESLKPYVTRFIQGDILDDLLPGRLVDEFEITTVFHLASILSTKAEYNPEIAHQVNVNGTLNLLRLAMEQSTRQNRPVKFIYPSSIAVYGLSDQSAKETAGKIKEKEFLDPTTMYGCNKLYCEHLGRYYARHYKRLAPETLAGKVDFRAIRFPGLISAVTVPSGGTSDFAPEMIHAAAQGKAFPCFARPDTRIPFMAMPDGVTALLQLAAAPHENLTRTVYNIGAFNPSAAEIESIVRKAFPFAEISYQVDVKRQGILDSWPADVDDSAARHDWGFAPQYDLDRAFDEYLIPTIRQRYR